MLGLTTCWPGTVFLALPQLSFQHVPLDTLSKQFVCQADWKLHAVYTTRIYRHLSIANYHKLSRLETMSTSAPPLHTNPVRQGSNLTNGSQQLVILRQMPTLESLMELARTSHRATDDNAFIEDLGMEKIHGLADNIITKSVLKFFPKTIHVLNAKFDLQTQLDCEISLKSVEVDYEILGGLHSTRISITRFKTPSDAEAGFKHALSCDKDHLDKWTNKPRMFQNQNRDTVGFGNLALARDGAIGGPRPLLMWCHGDLWVKIHWELPVDNDSQRYKEFKGPDNIKKLEEEQAKNQAAWAWTLADEGYKLGMALDKYLSNPGGQVRRKLLYAYEPSEKLMLVVGWPPTKHDLLTSKANPWVVDVKADKNYHSIAPQNDQTFWHVLIEPVANAGDFMELQPPTPGSKRIQPIAKKRGEGMFKLYWAHKKNLLIGCVEFYFKVE
ncbi:hypothetical protein B0T24DRAFT_598009 [Lasiosphaeria ovina]|uniref:Uncharacterized protein n=1 Tax=Lasiosphaeria ovina TaxID=92902 RepID=A0AAE0JY99_9PEZI|nr:hypothetical protein B0T24DRAFT_598009 [Lasiosphaeria ovina]